MSSITIIITSSTEKERGGACKGNANGVFFYVQSIW